MMPPETPGVRELIRRLIVQEASLLGTTDSPAIAAHVACERVYERLSVWLGASGCHALFSRALVATRARHPAVRDIVLRAASESTLDGAPESIKAYGAAAVAAGLETLLATVFDLLGNLIGYDMATRLIEHAVPKDVRGDEVIR